MMHDLASKLKPNKTQQISDPPENGEGGGRGEERAAVHPCICPSYSAPVLYIRYI